MLWRGTVQTYKHIFGEKIDRDTPEGRTKLYSMVYLLENQGYPLNSSDTNRGYGFDLYSIVYSGALSEDLDELDLEAETDITFTKDFIKSINKVKYFANRQGIDQTEWLRALCALHIVRTSYAGSAAGRDEVIKIAKKRSSHLRQMEDSILVKAYNAAVEFSGRTYEADKKRRKRTPKRINTLARRKCMKTKKPEIGVIKMDRMPAIEELRARMKKIRRNGEKLKKKCAN